ncbi:K02A2.6-like [Cordylochernes scorpioides]|uniref:K02A2.6-like n=1 Tax=Cordylochernes scorpioides TaxID=51811 RepID=A0ABY6KNG1_9ARAC|nr:K02A2.6-like [Cordylochernes scorpioides]
MCVCGIQHLKSAPYYPATNGLAERFVQTSKIYLRSINNEGLNKSLANFLFTYRSVQQSSTKEAPAVLFLKRMPKSRWNLLRPKFESKAKLGKKTFPEFEVSEDALVRDHFGPNRWIEGEITEKLGKCFYRILLRDKRVWRRHAGQIRKNSTLPCPDPEVFLPTPLNVQRNNEEIPLDKTATSSSR